MDWSAIKTEYVTGDKTYAQLAEEHGVSEKTVQKHASNAKWREAREEFRRETGVESLKQARTRGAHAHARELEVLIEANRLQEELILQAMKEPDLSPGAILKLSLALESAAKTKRNLLGLPTQAEAHSQRIAGARLNLEKAKQQAAGGKKEPVEVKITVATDDEADTEELSG